MFPYVGYSNPSFATSWYSAKGCLIFWIQTQLTVLDMPWGQSSTFVLCGHSVLLWKEHWKWSGGFRWVQWHLYLHTYNSIKDLDYKTSAPKPKVIYGGSKLSLLILSHQWGSPGFVFLFLSFFFVTSFPDFSICPIVGLSFRLISEITKVSIKIYYARVNKYFRQIFSKQCR